MSNWGMGVAYYMTGPYFESLNITSLSLSFSFFIKLFSCLREKERTKEGKHKRSIFRPLEVDKNCTINMRLLEKISLENRVTQIHWLFLFY